MTLGFYQYVAVDGALRDASSAAEAAFDEYDTDKSMRVDVFNAKAAAKAHIAKSNIKLDAQDQRLVDKMLLDGTRAGLALPDAEREKLMALQKELTATCHEFKVSVTVPFRIYTSDYGPRETVAKRTCVHGHTQPEYVLTHTL